LTRVVKGVTELQAGDWCGFREAGFLLCVALGRRDNVWCQGFCGLFCLGSLEFCVNGDKGLGVMSRKREPVKCTVAMGIGALVLIGVLLAGVTSWAADMGWGKMDVRSTTQYRLQWSDDPNDLVNDDQDDQDFFEILGVDGELNSGVSFAFLGKYAKDLDGTASGSIFQDYLDVSSDDRQRFDAFYAFVEKRDLLPGVDVRLGRQYAYGAETVHFDGLWLRADRLLRNWFSMEVFGGSIVQLYSDLDQDGVGGVNLEFHPTRDLALYVDSVFYRENSFEGSVYWRPMEGVKANSRISFINDHTKEFSVDLIGTCPVTDTTVGINVYRRFKIAASTEDDFIYDYTFSVGDGLKQDIKRLYLGREIGYVEFTISVSQPIPHQEGLSVFARYTNRQLTHDSEEDLYNTDFQRWTLGFSLNDWWVLKGTHLSVGYSHWREDRDFLYEAESKSVFADLSQEIGEKWELGGGFYYKDEDVNSLIEGEAAAHYYGAVKYKLSNDKWAELKYEYEDDDYYDEFGISSINALTATVHVRF